MKILMSCVPFDGGKSGISVYLLNVVRALLAEGHSLTLIVDPNAVDSFPAECQLLPMPAFTRRPVFSMLYHMFVLPFRIFSMRHAFDLMILGAANRRALLFYPIPAVAVVHDLSQYHLPRKYDAFRMFYIKRLLPWFVRRADCVAAISESTARDLQMFWHIPESKIFINYNGLSLPQTSRAGWLEKMHIEPHSYLLYFSRIEHPGKNHLNLIRAYEMLPDALTRQYKLVLAGAKWPGSEPVFEAAESSPLHDRILFPGFIESADMAEVYQNAAAYIFPSFYEGFGLSLVEAMHYGVPCAVSQNSSLAEIAGDAALKFDPNSPDSIAAAIQKILTDSLERQRLIESGNARVLAFTWEKHARKLTTALTPEKTEVVS